jgi:hypothetical protein
MSITRFAVPVFALALTSGAGAAPVLQGKNTCNYNGNSICLYFYVQGIPFTGQSIDFKAPGPGKALVSVTGSGVCTNGNTAVGNGVFDTQIVDDPSATPTYGGAGGNKFEFTLPANNGSEQFNLASQRLFGVKKAGTKHYALNFVAGAFDPYIQCNVNSIAMSVLFLPG